MEIDVLQFRRARTVSRDSPHITDSFQTHVAWFPYDRYDLCAGKKFSDRSDHMETTLQRLQRQRSLRLTSVLSQRSWRS